MNVSKLIQWQVIVNNKISQPSNFEVMKLAVESVVSKMELNFKNIGRFPENQQENIIDDLQTIQIAKRNLFNAIMHLKLSGGLL